MVEVLVDLVAGEEEAEPGEDARGRPRLVCEHPRHDAAREGAREQWATRKGKRERGGGKGAGERGGRRATQTARLLAAALCAGAWLARWRVPGHGRLS